jgi:sulfur-oxidizing protein SoxX
MRGGKQMGLRQTYCVLAVLAGAVLGAFALGLTPASAAPSEGQKLVAAHCLTCHEVKGGADFGNVGPSLIDLKSRYADRKEVAAIIFDETKHNPQTVMPPFGRNLIVNQKEIDAMVDFLYTQ